MLLAVLLSALGFASASPAATYCWDPNQTASANGSGGGTWDNTATEFYNGTADVAWTDGNTASFGGPAGTYAVGLGAPISALNLQFTGSGYTVTADATNTLTLTGGFGVAGTGATVYNGAGTNTLAGPFTIATTGSSVANLSAAAGTTLNITGAITQNTPSTAGLNVSGGGTVTYGGNSTTAWGKFNVVGGTTFTSTGNIAGFTQTYTGVTDTVAGTTWNINGGTVSAGTTLFTGGTNSGGTINMNAGTASFSAINLGNYSNGAGDGYGTLSINGGTLTSGKINLGSAKSGVGVLNLNGGILNLSVSGGTSTAPSVAFGVGAGSSGTGGSGTINFNGGTLRPTVTYQSVGGLTTANVRNGGVIVATNGLILTISQPLLHSTISGDNAIDGGLTKNGTGTLILTGANTYTGATTLTAGTLTVGTGGTLGATTGALNVSNPNTGFNSQVSLNLATAVDTTVGSLSGTIATASAGTNTAVINTGGTGRNFTVNQTVAGTFAGQINGAGAFTLGSLSTNTLTLTGANGFTGGTTLAGGVLQVGSNGALGGTSGSVAFTGGTLRYGTGITTDYSGRIANSTGAISVDTGSNSVAFANPLTNTNTGGLTKLGSGTLTLNMAEAYTGSTTVNNGTLALNFNTGSALASNILPSASTLVLGGGTLSVLAKSATATSQTVNNLTLNSGGSSIAVNPAATNPSSIVLNLGAITRNSGGTINFTLPTGSQNSGYGITTTSANTAGSVLGGWATVGLNDWAVSGGDGTNVGNITALGSYFVYDNVSGLSGAGVNGTSNLTDNNGYDATYTNSVTVNSLRFNASGSDSNFGLVSGQNLTVNSGGILVTSNVGAKYQRIGFLNTNFNAGEGQGGITSSAGDLVINQNNGGSGHLEIYSAVYGTGVNLVKSGVGYLELRGLGASYSGATVVNGGTMKLTAATTGTSAVTINNTGTLLLGANDRINDAATVRLNGGTLNTGGFQEGRATGTAAATAGLGALTLSSSSTLDFGSGHAGSSVLAFAASNAQTWSGTLTLTDFTPGTDFLNFGLSTGLTSTQLNDIFYNGSAAAGLDSFGNVLFTAVPEPATWAAGVLLVGLTGWHLRRRPVRRAA